MCRTFRASVNSLNCMLSEESANGTDSGLDSVSLPIERFQALTCQPMRLPRRVPVSREPPAVKTSPDEPLNRRQELWIKPPGNDRGLRSRNQSSHELSGILVREQGAIPYLMNTGSVKVASVLKLRIDVEESAVIAKPIAIHGLAR